MTLFPRGVVFGAIGRSHSFGSQLLVCGSTFDLVYQPSHDRFGEVVRQIKWRFRNDR